MLFVIYKKERNGANYGKKCTNLKGIINVNGKLYPFRYRLLYKWQFWNRTWISAHSSQLIIQFNTDVWGYNGKKIVDCGCGVTAVLFL